MSDLKYIPPKFRRKAFNCPHCDAFAHQRWFDVRAYLDNNDCRSFILGKSPHGNENIECSICTQCKFATLWKRTHKRRADGNADLTGDMIFPNEVTAPRAHPDMPRSAKLLYNEAREVSAMSPRAAAALLRCSLEELIKELGEAKGNLKKRIENLVDKKKFPPEIQKALHTLRIFANEGGSHVGVIDLSGQDNKDTVDNLFGIMNFIVQRMVSDPKVMEDLYSRIPEEKKKDIENSNKNLNDKG